MHYSLVSSVFSFFFFLAKNLEIRIDTSYKIITGKAREICEKGSGGVIIAAKTNDKTLELTKFQDNEYIKPNKYHPNQKGHELIAKNLHDFITKND